MINTRDTKTNTLTHFPHKQGSAVNMSGNLVTLHPRPSTNFFGSLKLEMKNERTHDANVFPETCM